MKSLKTKIVVLVLALGLCFVGLCCTTNDKLTSSETSSGTSSYSSSQTTDSESIFEKTKKPPRVAIQGCVIIRDDGHTITIRRKCEKCGNVETSTETRGSSSVNTTFTCRKCGNRQKLEIK